MGEQFCSKHRRSDQAKEYAKGAAREHQVVKEENPDSDLDPNWVRPEPASSSGGPSIAELVEAMSAELGTPVFAIEEQLALGSILDEIRAMCSFS